MSSANQSPPVNFEDAKKTASTGNGYPVQIKARDLDANFEYATLEIDPTLTEEKVVRQGHKKRRLRIPGLPPSGDVVLKSVDGVMEWGQGGGGVDLPFTAVASGASVTVKGGIARNEVNSLTFSDYTFTPNNNDFVWLDITTNATTRAWTSGAWGSGSSVPASTTTSLIILVCRIAVGDGAASVIRQEPPGDIFLREYIVLINGDLFYEQVPVRADLIDLGV